MPDTFPSAGISSTFSRLGETIQRARAPIQRRSPKAVNVSKYNGISSSVQGYAGKYGQQIGELGTLTVPYGGFTQFEKFHPGLDIANKEGTSIPTFVPGKVTAMTSGQKHGSKGFGNYVVITDPLGGQHRYSHLKQAYVKVGENVSRGQKIGEMGATGQTYSTTGTGEGPHLDYRIYDTYGKYVNPFVYLQRFKSS